jgi:hypothetical protein
MQGKKAPKTGATSPLPSPYVPGKSMPYERSKPGQGPGESDVPAEARRIVRNCTKRIKLPRARG